MPNIELLRKNLEANNFQTSYFPTKEEALPEARRQMEQPGTVMLAKASHAMKFEWLVERLRETGE